jgi:hypothetical protein
VKKQFRTVIGRSAEINKDEVEDLKRTAWAIDCPRLELKPRGDTSVAYRGPGSLQQNEEGQLTYKIYAAQPDDSHHLHQHGYGPAGTRIPESAYFDLTAEDIRGRLWSSERLLPGSSGWGPAQEPVVEGRVDELSCEGEIPSEIDVKGCSLAFTVFDNVSIPENAKTSEHHYIAGWSWSRHSRRDAWRFRAAGYGFLLSNHRKDRLQIDVTSKAEEPPHYLGQRVLEALFFVLGRPLYPTIARSRTGHRTGCTIYSERRTLVGARNQPPLRIEHISHPKTRRFTAEPYRKLFERYFAHVLPYDGIHHPLWGQLNALYEASAGMFVDSQALTLAVAIEGILGSEFPALGKLTTAERKRIDDALEYWKRWDGDPELKQRIQGMISPLRHSGAGDKMKALAKQGAITAEAVKTWKKLRNISVHEYQRHSLDPEEFWRLLSMTQTLFYQLIFAAVGYRGPYRDYSVVGWPVRQYPPSTSERVKGTEIEAV